MIQYTFEALFEKHKNKIFPSVPKDSSFIFTKNCSLNFFLGENFSIPKNNKICVEATNVLPYTCFMKLMMLFWWLATHNLLTNNLIVIETLKSGD
jgi:hypothetical protein